MIEKRHEFPFYVFITFVLILLLVALLLGCVSPKECQELCVPWGVEHFDRTTCRCRPFPKLEVSEAAQACDDSIVPISSWATDGHTFSCERERLPSLGVKRMKKPKPSEIKVAEALP